MSQKVDWSFPRVYGVQPLIHPKFTTHIKILGPQLLDQLANPIHIHEFELTGWKFNSNLSDFLHFILGESQWLNVQPMKDVEIQKDFCCAHWHKKRFFHMYRGSCEAWGGELR